MTTGSKDVFGGQRWRHIRLLAAFSLVVVLASPGAASAQTVGIPPETVALIQNLFGPDFGHTPTGEETTDPTGDAQTFGGDPVPGESGITAAGWHDVNGELLPGAIESICAENSEPVGPGSVAICPENRSSIAAATNFVMIYAIMSQGIDVAAKFNQFAFFWAEAGLEVYDGAPGDPNNNETDSFDLYVAATLLSLGRTSYRDGGFIFDPAYGGMLAFLGPRIVALLIPRDQFFDSCLNVAVALITEGGVIDKVSLPDNTTGTFARTAPPATPAPTPAPSSAPTPPPPPETGPATTAAPPPSTTAPPDAVGPPVASDPPAPPPVAPS